MRKIYLILGGVFGILLLISVFLISYIFFGVRPPYYQVEGLEDVTRIEVWENSYENMVAETRTLKIIDNLQEIEQITRVIDLMHRGWQHDGFSPPSTGSMGRQHPIWIVFYGANHKAGDKAQVVLSLGYSDRNRYSLQVIYGPGRYLTEDEFEEIISLLGIDESMAYYP